jgi:hypothetical protein
MRQDHGRLRFQPSRPAPNLPHQAPASAQRTQASHGVDTTKSISPCPIREQYRRQADIADRDDGRRPWADCAPTGATSEGPEHVPLGARNRLHWPSAKLQTKEVFINIPLSAILDVPPSPNLTCPLFYTEQWIPRIGAISCPPPMRRKLHRPWTLPCCCCCSKRCVWEPKRGPSCDGV